MPECWDIRARSRERLQPLEPRTPKEIAVDKRTIQAPSSAHSTQHIQDIPFMFVLKGMRSAEEGDFHLGPRLCSLTAGNFSIFHIISFQ